jgi:hypothetical protein
VRVELTTFCLQDSCSSQLSYTGKLRRQGSNLQSLGSKPNMLPITPLRNKVVGEGLEPSTRGFSTHCSTHLSYPTRVGMAGLEPATFCLEDRHSCSTELHPEKISSASNLKRGYGSHFQVIKKIRVYKDQYKKSERRDLNSRPPGYQPSALNQLSYAPIN